MTTLAAVLRLARVSNLPTVWSNVLAASVLAGGVETGALAWVLVAMSALYTGGMVLNDAFDREIDARERPERPLPSGQISLSAVWIIGASLLAAGVGVLASFGAGGAMGGSALAAAILLYDAWHKGNSLSPVIMGLCRALVYVTTALAAGAALSPAILGAALILLLYVVALTQLAKRGVPYVGLLIAGIALMDAGFAAAYGNALVAALCAGFFLLTLALQRIVPGT
ncbi:UbiA family prenyltransferase [Hyphomicrobium sp.]|uniref:UbiA family prenyltransferase n=1 Tax=Hyphomicrobium sp. TaxID=82 RepID=UPI002E2EC282|nr:UbiA family prenyltransferase [Hyphomicrobium sp.]HEX2841078.1 UbiA family prenyltransferase [Hyphomicrobium sp.]